MTEERWPLPSGWKWVPAQDVGNIVGGGTPTASDPTNFAEDDGVPWITPADLTEYEGTYISRGRRNLSKKGLASCGATLMPAGTVLYSSRAPIGYCAIATSPISTNQGFKSLVLREGVIP
jgi:type I restriction enzyme S subunit